MSRSEAFLLLTLGDGANETGKELVLSRIWRPELIPGKGDIIPIRLQRGFPVTYFMVKSRIVCPIDSRALRIFLELEQKAPLLAADYLSKAGWKLVSKVQYRTDT